jgi:hypothetical protein
MNLQELIRERDKAYMEYIELDWLVFINRDHNSISKHMSFENVVSRLQNQIHPPPEHLKAEFEMAVKILTEGQAYLTKDEPKRIVFFDNNASK